MGEELTPPKETAGDKAHAVVRGALGAVPVAGAAAVEFFNGLIIPPIMKRRQHWMEEVASALAKLQAEGRIDLDALREDEGFISLLIEATLVAAKTHQREKREALRNAVVNRSLQPDLDETLQHIFLRLVDELSPLHLQLLQMAHNPIQWGERTGIKLPALYHGAFSTLIEKGIPELNGKRDVYERLWEDLVQRGLVNKGGIHTMMTASGVWDSWTKPLGKEFLGFIEDSSTAGT